MNQSQPIPNRLNVAVVTAQLICIAACVIACTRAGGWWWIVVAVAFALVMNSVYFMIHEAQHGILFSNPMLNDFVGTVLSLFMPASYTLIRRVHLAHHIHNRS